MKVAIVGSRHFGRMELIYPYIAMLEKDTEVISGGATGVDAAAALAAYQLGLKVTQFLPEWGAFGKSAGAIRNKKIVETADEIVAFWDGDSKGTKITIDLAEKAGKPVRIIRDK